VAGAASMSLPRGPTLSATIAARSALARVPARTPPLREIGSEDQATVDLHSNSVPSDHIVCSITASFRATAICAFFSPARCTILRPHSRSGVKRSIRVSKTLAASKITAGEIVAGLGDAPYPVDLAGLVSPRGETEVCPDIGRSPEAVRRAGESGRKRNRLARNLVLTQASRRRALEKRPHKLSPKMG